MDDATATPETNIPESTEATSQVAEQTADQSQETSVINAGEKPQEAFDALFRENTVQPAEDAKPDEEPVKPDETPVEEEFSFEPPVASPEEESKPDSPIAKVVSALADNPEALAALQEAQSQIDNERAGFQKLHEQVTTVRSILGHQSLNDVAKDLEVLKEQVALVGRIQSEEPIVRDQALRDYLADAIQFTGLSGEEVYGILTGMPGPTGTRPSKPPTLQEAWKVIEQHEGIKPEDIQETKIMKGAVQYADKTAAHWEKVSEKVGFKIDPQKMYRVQTQYKNLPGESLVAIAYPSEYKTYVANAAQKTSALAAKRASAPNLASETAPAGKVAFKEMTEAQRVAQIKELA